MRCLMTSLRPQASTGNTRADDIGRFVLSFFVNDNSGSGQFAPRDIHNAVLPKMNGQLDPKETAAALAALAASGHVRKLTDPSTGKDVYELVIETQGGLVSVPMPSSVADYFGDPNDSKGITALRILHLVENILTYMEMNVHDPEIQAHEKEKRMEALAESLEIDKVAVKALTGLDFVHDPKVMASGTAAQAKAGELRLFMDEKEMAKHVAKIMGGVEADLHLGALYDVNNTSSIQTLRGKVLRGVVDRDRVGSESDVEIMSRIINSAKRTLGGNVSIPVLQLYNDVIPDQGTMNMAEFIGLLGRMHSDPDVPVEMDGLRVQGKIPMVKYSPRIGGSIRQGHTLPAGRYPNSQNLVASLLMRAVHPRYGLGIKYSSAAALAERLWQAASTDTWKFLDRFILQIPSADFMSGNGADFDALMQSAQGLPARVQEFVAEVLEKPSALKELLAIAPPSDKAAIATPGAVPEGISRHTDQATLGIARWALSKAPVGSMGIVARAYVQDGLDHSALTDAEKKDVASLAEAESATVRLYVRKKDGSAARLIPRKGGKYEKATDTGSSSGVVQTVPALLKEPDTERIEVWADPAADAIGDLRAGSADYDRLHSALALLMNGIAAKIEGRTHTMLGAAMGGLEQFREDMRKAFIRDWGMGQGEQAKRRYPNYIANVEALNTAEQMYGGDLLGDLVRENGLDAVANAFGLAPGEVASANQAGKGLSQVYMEQYKNGNEVQIMPAAEQLSLPAAAPLNFHVVDAIDLGSVGPSVSAAFWELSGVKDAANDHLASKRYSRLGVWVSFESLGDAQHTPFRDWSDLARTQQEMNQAARNLQEQSTVISTGYGTAGQPDMHEESYGLEIMHDLFIKYPRLGKAYAVWGVMLRNLRRISPDKDGEGFYDWVARQIAENPELRAAGHSVLPHELEHALQFMNALGTEKGEIEGKKDAMGKISVGRVTEGAHLKVLDDFLRNAGDMPAGPQLIKTFFDVMLRKAYYRAWKPGQGQMLAEAGMTDADVAAIVAREAAAGADITTADGQLVALNAVLTEISERMEVIGFDYALAASKIDRDFLHNLMTGKGMGPKSKKIKSVPVDLQENMELITNFAKTNPSAADLLQIVQAQGEKYNALRNAIRMLFSNMSALTTQGVYWTEDVETTAHLYERIVRSRLVEMSKHTPGLNPMVRALPTDHAFLAFDPVKVAEARRFFERFFEAALPQEGNIPTYEATDFSEDMFLQVDRDDLLRMIRDANNAATGNAGTTYEPLPGQGAAKPAAKGKSTQPGHQQLDLVFHGSGAGLIHDGKLVARFDTAIGDALRTQTLSMRGGLTPLNIIALIEKGVMQIGLSMEALDEHDLADLNVAMHKFTNEGKTLAAQVHAAGQDWVTPLIERYQQVFLTSGKTVGRVTPKSDRAKKNFPFKPFKNAVTLAGRKVKESMTNMITSAILAGIKIEPYTKGGPDGPTGFPQDVEAFFKDQYGLDDKEIKDIFIDNPGNDLAINEVQLATLVKTLIANERTYHITEKGMVPVLHSNAKDLLANYEQRAYRQGFLAGLGMGAGKTRIMATLHRARSAIARKNAAAHMAQAAANDTALAKMMKNDPEAAHIHLWRKDRAYRTIVSQGQTVVITGGASKEGLFHGMYKAQYEVGNMPDELINSDEVKKRLKQGKGIIDGNNGYRIVNPKKVIGRLGKGWMDTSGGKDAMSLPDELVPRPGDFVYIETYEWFATHPGGIDPVRDRTAIEGDPLEHSQDANKAGDLFRKMARPAKNMRTVFALLGMPSIGQIRGDKGAYDQHSVNPNEFKPELWDWWDGTIMLDESDNTANTKGSERQEGKDETQSRSTGSSTRGEMARELQRLLPGARVSMFTGTPLKNEDSVIAMERIVMPMMTTATKTPEELRNNIHWNPDAVPDIIMWIVRTGSGVVSSMEQPPGAIKHHKVNVPHFKGTYTLFYQRLNKLYRLLEQWKETAKHIPPPMTLVTGGDVVPLATANDIELRLPDANDPELGFVPNTKTKVLERKTKTVKVKGKKVTIPSFVSTKDRVSLDTAKIKEIVMKHLDEMNRYAQVTSKDMKWPDAKNAVAYVTNRPGDAMVKRYLGHLLFHGMAKIVEQNDERFVEMPADLYPTQNRLLAFEIIKDMQMAFVQYPKVEDKSRQDWDETKVNPAQMEQSMAALPFNHYMWMVKNGGDFRVRQNDGGFREKIRLENSPITIRIDDDGDMWYHPPAMDGKYVKKFLKEAPEGVKKEVEITRREIADMMGVSEDGLVFIGKDSMQSAHVYMDPTKLLRKSQLDPQAATGISHDLTKQDVQGVQFDVYPPDAMLAIDELASKMDALGQSYGEISGRESRYVPWDGSSPMRRVRIEKDAKGVSSQSLIDFNNEKDSGMLVQYDAGSRGVEYGKTEPHQRTRHQEITEFSKRAQLSAQMSGRTLRQNSIKSENFVRFLVAALPAAQLVNWIEAAKVATMSEASTGQPDAMSDSLTEAIPLLDKEGGGKGPAYLKEPMVINAWDRVIEDWKQHPQKYKSDMQTAWMAMFPQTQQYDPKVWDEKSMSYFLDPSHHHIVGRLDLATAEAVYDKFAEYYQLERVNEEMESGGYGGLQTLPGSIVEVGSAEISNSTGGRYGLVFANYQEARVLEDFDVVFGRPVRGANEPKTTYNNRVGQWESALMLHEVQNTVGGKPYTTFYVIDTNRRRSDVVNAGPGGGRFVVDQDPVYAVTREIDPATGKPGRIVDIYSVLMQSNDWNVLLTQGSIKTYGYQEARDIWHRELAQDPALKDPDFNQKVMFLSGGIADSEAFGMPEYAMDMQKVVVNVTPDLARKLGGERESSTEATAWLVRPPKGGRTRTHSVDAFERLEAKALIEAMWKNGDPHFSKHGITPSDVIEWFRDGIQAKNKNSIVIRKADRGIIVTGDKINETTDRTVMDVRRFKRSGKEGDFTTITDRNNLINNIAGQGIAVGGIIDLMATEFDNQDTRLTPEEQIMLLHTLVGIPDEELATIAAYKKGKAKPTP